MGSAGYEFSAIPTPGYGFRIGGKHLTEIDGLPRVADVVATVTGVRTARVVVRFRYNGGVSMTSAAASCGPLAGGPAEWGAVTAVQSGAWSATFLSSGLQPNTTYVCWANATNGAGTSANVWSGNFTTYTEGIRIDAAMLATAPASFGSRRDVASAIFRNGSSGYKLFVAGGGDMGGFLYDAAVLDIVDSNTWTKLSWTFPWASALAACAWDEMETIYCADDLNFWSYSASSLTATTLDDVPVAITINCATFWNNSFWVMSDATANMYRWTPNTNWIKETTVGIPAGTVVAGSPCVRIGPKWYVGWAAVPVAGTAAKI
eukprot:tig00000158_g10207.t1